MQHLNIEATVHKQVKNGYRVKVSIPEMGMYINGMMVYPPNSLSSDWVVYPPAIRSQGGYRPVIEFNKSKPLWLAINKACTEAVKLDQYQQRLSSSYDDIDLSNDVDLSTIPD